MITPREWARSIVVFKGMMLWVTGGRYNGSDLYTTELVTTHSAMPGPNLPFSMRHHCLVKINEQKAILQHANHTWMYSIHDKEISRYALQGPDLPLSIYSGSCGFLTDMGTGIDLMVITGGYVVVNITPTDRNLTEAERNNTRSEENYTRTRDNQTEAEKNYIRSKGNYTREDGNYTRIQDNQTETGTAKVEMIKETLLWNLGTNEIIQGPTLDKPTSQLPAITTPDRKSFLVLVDSLTTQWAEDFTTSIISYLYRLQCRNLKCWWTKMPHDIHNSARFQVLMFLPSAHCKGKVEQRQ